MRHGLADQRIGERLELRVEHADHHGIVLHRIHGEAFGLERRQVFLLVGPHHQIDFAVAQGNGGGGFVLDDVEDDRLDRRRPLVVALVALEHDLRADIDRFEVVGAGPDGLPAHLLPLPRWLSG
jgi:hypothetical protein